jgi:hypothetical protein
MDTLTTGFEEDVSKEEASLLVLQELNANMMHN